MASIALSGSSQLVGPPDLGAGQVTFIVGAGTTDATYTNQAVPPTSTPTGTPAPATSTPTAAPTSIPTAVLPTSTPTATSAIAIGPGSGSVGTTVTGTGTNFGANEPVAVSWSNTVATARTQARAGTVARVPAHALTGTAAPVGAASGAPLVLSAAPLVTPTTTLAGSFVVTFTVPQAISGTHTITAQGQSSGRTASAGFRVKPETFLGRTFGVQGSFNALVGFGFGPTEAVKAYWYPGFRPLGRAVTTNALGTFAGTAAISFTVPYSPTGTYYVIAVGQNSHGVAASKFVLTPALYVSPSSGAHGSAATVIGTGYKAGEVVTVKWDCATATCSGAGMTVLGTRAANANGDVVLGVTIPATATVGTHTLGGSGAGGTFATTAFKVTS